MIRLRARDGADPRELAAMDINLHLDTPILKRKYVLVMFDLISPGYDAFTRLFSFGMDRRWKRALAKEGARRAGRVSTVLDLACGTGDLGIELAGRVGASLVLGVDFSPQMLKEAKARSSNNGAGLTLVACDMLNLCVRERCFDMASVGYGIRNTTDVGHTLRSIASVLKPGGLLLSLDFYRPADDRWRKLFLWYMWNAGRAAGWLWHREPMAYGYLAHSIRRYLTIPEFEAALSAAGFEVEWRASQLGGAIGLHVSRLTRATETPSALC